MGHLLKRFSPIPTLASDAGGSTTGVELVMDGGFDAMMIQSVSIPPPATTFN